MTDTRFTPEQRVAVEIDPQQPRNLIVAAGAGSGKTHVLVERYVALLDAYRDMAISQIVAITFTREAALEMQNRVRTAIEGRMRTATNPADVAHWTERFRHMDSARIDTIHALCGAILRANAAQARLDPTFDVIEPFDAAQLRSAIISDVLQELGEADPRGILELFNVYDDTRIQDALSPGEIDFATLQRAAEESVDERLSRWRQAWHTRILTELKPRVIELLSDHSHWMSAGFDKTLGDAWDAAAQTLDTLKASQDAAGVVAALQDMIAVTKKARGSPRWQDERVEALADIKFIQGVCDDLLKAFATDPGEDREAARLAGLWAALLHRVEADFAQAKRALNVLDFNDLERLTVELLQDESVAARYQSGEIRQILVDEFQDTNARQWAIVRALANPARAGSLFVVGDRKQSIYGFRGADVSVFKDVRQEIVGHAHGRDVSLSISFRSHQRLLDCFNALFERVLAPEPYGVAAAYEAPLDMAMQAQRTDTLEGDPVSLLLVNRDMAADDDLSADDARSWEAYEVGLQLKQMVDNQQLIYDKATGTHRPVQYGDMAILVRARNSMKPFEDVFQIPQLNIPTVTVAGIGFYEQQEVWDVMNMLRALYDPHDDLSLAAALRSPLFAFSDDMLLGLRRMNPEAHLWDAIMQAHETIPRGFDTERAQQTLTITRRILGDLVQLAGRVTIRELLDEMLRRTGYLATLTMLPGGHKKRRNVEKLVTIAQDSGRVTLSEFAQYLQNVTASNELRESQAVLDAEDAVKLMTVHGSKGLEFPVVVVADITRRSRGGAGVPLAIDSRLGIGCKVLSAKDDGSLEWSSIGAQIEMVQKARDAAEEKRLIYVAATRARDYLLLSGSVKQNKSGISKEGWLRTICAAFDDDTLVDGAVTTVNGVPVVRVSMPDYPPGLLERLRTKDAPAQLDEATSIYEPPLLASLPAVRERMMEHLSATQLEQIGGLHFAADRAERDGYRLRLRANVLDDAVLDVPEVVRDRDYEPRVSRAVTGDMVHEAIRFWQLPAVIGRDAARAMLASYAWERHVTDPDDVEYAVMQALRLLERFQSSHVCRWITDARAAGHSIYQEMPVIWRQGKRVIHGIIDMLLQRADGSWIIVDYKTSRIEAYDNRLAGLEQAAQEHATRYVLQVAAYAAAVQARFGADIQPEAVIYYIRYNHHVTVPAAQWRAEWANLERYIGDAVHDIMDETRPRSDTGLGTAD